MNSLQHFNFIRPYWFLALIPLMFLLWRLQQTYSKASSWQKVCDPHLLKALLVKTGNVATRWPLYLLGITWFITVFALAGPTWKKAEKSIYRSLASQVIVLDLSASMYATDIKPSRLARAKFKVLDILKRSKQDQTGLIVFSGEPYVVSPLTSDAATIASMVPVLSPNIMPVSGADVSPALTEAGKLMQQAGVNHGSILLITANAGKTKAISEAETLKKQGYVTSVLAVGTQQGTPIKLPSGAYLQNREGGIATTKVDITQLQKLAAAGGGVLVNFTNSNQDINTLLKSSLSLHFNRQTKKTKSSTNVWQDEGRYFILLLLPIALLAFRRGYL